MNTKQLKEVYFTEDGIVDGPEVTQCMGIGGSDWLNHPIELYSLVSDGEVTRYTVPYHAHFSMTKEKARANWWRLTPSAKARILQCTTVSFEMPPEWWAWNNAYLEVLYNDAHDKLREKPHSWYLTTDEEIKHWLDGNCPVSIANLVLTQSRYVPHRRMWLNFA